ncbi:MAG: cytochrome c [Cytophagales bacterium]|nr:cytochrome c [Cytophagales bacterium]
MKSIGSIFLSVAIAILMVACGGSGKKDKGKFAPPTKAKPLTYEEAVADWKNQKGLGPIKHVELGEIDPELAKKGEEIYVLKCTACHAPDKEKLGPAPTGIMERRTPEWIMNMILNPEEMAMKDPIGRGMLVKYNTVMANQGLTEEDARAVLEYFRTL